MDNPSARRDMEDLKVFRRVNIVEDQISTDRSYVFLDISIGLNPTGKIVIELVGSSLQTNINMAN